MFAVGDKAAEATAAGTPIRVGALLCAMRQADRWEEVAGLVVRYRDAGVVGFDLAGPEIGFPPDRIPAAIELLDRAGQALAAVPVLRLLAFLLTGPAVPARPLRLPALRVLHPVGPLLVLGTPGRRGPPALVLAA